MMIFDEFSPCTAYPIEIQNVALSQNLIQLNSII